MLAKIGGLHLAGNGMLLTIFGADVFFGRLTGFMNGKSWTYSMDKNSATEENTQKMMANQASPFNDCYRV